MFAHIVLIGLGYAGSSAHGYSGLLGELWDITWGLPGMLLAAAGTLCLVLVVVTSIRAARRRLRYESWHLMHLYAYLGVGLALPHPLWTGGDFLANPLATAYWWTAWAGTAAAVVLFRLGLPLYRSLRYRLVVQAVVPEVPGVVSVYLTGGTCRSCRSAPGSSCSCASSTALGPPALTPTRCPPPPPVTCCGSR